MNMLKITAAAALAAASLSASAMTSIADDQLSAISGQDGVSIAADLNINIGSFKYTDTDSTGGSVSFNNITVRGLMDMTIDVLNSTAFAGAVAQSIADNGGGAAGSAGNTLILAGVAQALGYNPTPGAGADVVQFAFPAAVGTGAAAAAHAVTPTITVGSITTGNGGASFGSFTITNLDLQGTKVWMFGH
jgi:hypothetical protein